VGPLTLREEHRLRVFENRVLRRTFGPKRDGVVVDWRKMHNEDFHYFVSSSCLISIMKSRIEWAKHISHMGKKRNAYRILMGKPEGNRLLGRPKHRWEHNSEIQN
jgi:hypothetical protein